MLSTTSRTSAPPTPAIWPRAIERLVAEGLALDVASGRGELVDRQRAAEIVGALEAYVDALPESEQAPVSRALVKRFAGAPA
jgi:hypothetical protein